MVQPATTVKVSNFIDIQLDLDREELLALLSYVAVGLHVLAIASGGEGSLSPHELSVYLSNIDADGAVRLTLKLTAAIRLSNRGTRSKPDS